MGNLTSWSIEGLFFAGFMTAFATLFIAPFVVAMVEVAIEERGKKIKKMKGIQVVFWWLGINLLIAFIPTILNKCFSLNEKMNVIIFFGTIIIFEIENIIFWSRVDNGEGENK